MKQEMKSRKTYDFESINERETRLAATAEKIYSMCQHDSLTVAEYERTKVLLDNMIYNRTIIRDQSSI